MSRQYRERNYQCPTCDQVYKIGTNHVGEIYSGCKNCGSMVLYCIEPEARQYEAEAVKVDADIVYYYLDISKPLDAKLYKLIERTTTEAKIPKWETHAKFVVKTSTWFKLIGAKAKEKKTVVVYDKDQWEHQFVTNFGRLHSWEEAIYPNKNIKEGYYLIFSK